MAEEVDPRVEMEATIKIRYRTDPGNYELSGPADNMLNEIAAFDKETFEDDPGEFLEMGEHLFEVTVKPVID